MSHQLDPVIFQKLQAFSQRRRKLIIVRGVCAALAMLLATMMFVALCDRLFVLSDWLRWTLSGLAYAAVVVVEWRSCLRLLMHAPGPRRLARLIEHAEPKLREDLLSAVELGDPKSDAHFDSEQFRSLVQSDVAHRMEGMEVERLLPVNLVRRYLGIAAVIVVALLVGFAFNGRQFGTLLARALFPGANLARVSQFQVSIVSPAPAELIVPHGETVPLIVSITGGRTSKAVLETFTPGGQREVVQMTPIGPDQFSATVQVARENVLYRVRAGDAITRKYKLDAVARPHVVAFAKTYTFPKYSRLESKKVSEENGDLAALEGSEVELRLEANQAVKNGELRVDQGRKQFTVPLVAGEGNRLTAKVPMNTSGTYRVFLVGAATGFENKFSPEYEIRAEADLVPSVDMELPKQDLIIPANEIVDVRGTASDDLALEKVAQVVKINGGPWKEFVLAKDAGTKVTVERRWDLFQEGVKPGDLLSMKLLAVDLKGHRIETRPVQITITASGFETKRLTSLDAQRDLFKTISELRAAADVLAKRGGEVRESFERLPEGDAQRKQACVSGTSAVGEFVLKLDETWTQLNATIRTAGAGHETHDLVLAGRLLAKINAATVQYGRDSLEVAAANPAAPGARDFVRQFAESAEQASQRTRLLQEAYRVFLIAEEVDVLSENMYVVMREQERLTMLAQNSGDDAKKWALLADRMRAVTGETRALEGQMTTTAAHSEHADRWKNWLAAISKQRVLVDNGLATGAPGKALLDPTMKLAKATADSSKQLLDLKRDWASRPVEMARKLLAEAGPAWENFGRLKQEVQAVSGSDKIVPELRQQLVDRRWERRGAMLKLHGDLEEGRLNADSYFVSDVRATTLALQGIKAVSGEAGWDKKLGDLDLGFRILESGHNLAEAIDGLNFLAVNERWEIYTPRSRTSNPRDWMWLENRVRLLPEELGKIQQPEPLRQIVAEAQQILWKAGQHPSWKMLVEEMKDRTKPDRAPMGLPQDVDKIAAEVKRALDLLRKPMEDARQALAQMTPKVSELAAQLAKETEDLKKETEEQKAKAPEKKPEEVAADTQQKIAEQQKLNAKVDTLKDLIRAEANKQNVLEKEGRELARDADDALAMLKEPPPKAEAALQDAAKADQPEARETAMHEATQQQQKLADSLNQIAQHFENAQNGKADETRLAMRATEQENGVKAELDAQYAKAEQFAQLAQKSPEEMLKQLEAALAKNPEMQKELSQISQDALTGAQQQLAKASQQEAQVAKNVDQLASQPPPPSATPSQNAKQAAEKAVAAAEAARQAADEAVQAAKKAGNETAANQAREARTQATEATQAAREAQQAAEQMAQASQSAQTAQQAQAAAQQPQQKEAAEQQAKASAQQAQAAAQQVAQKAGEAAKDAQMAADSAAQAQQTAEKTAAQQSGEQQANNKQTSKEATEAVQAAQAAVQAAQMAQAAAQQAMAQDGKPQMAQNAQSPQPGQPQAPQAGQPQAAQNPQLAQAAQQQTPIAQNAQKAGQDVARAGRHEERLQNMAAGAQLQQLGEQIQQTAAQQVPAAQQALTQAQMAKDAQAPVNAANAELANQLAQLQAAAGEQPAQNGEQPAQGQPQPAQPQAGQPQAGQPQAGQPQPGQPQAGQPQQGQPQAGQPQAGQPPQSAPLDRVPLLATPQEQVWMARTLDALDTALNTPASPAADQTAQAGQPAPSQQGQPQPGQPQPGQPGQPGQPQPGQPGQPSQAMTPAQQAMAAAAQAAAQAMKTARSEMPAQPGPESKSDELDRSENGSVADSKPYGTPAEAKNLKRGDWGKLPKQVAEELSQGQREAVAGEYRNQVETYYRVIAERAKKQ